jgi:hypothetical protein
MPVGGQDPTSSPVDLCDTCLVAALPDVRAFFEKQEAKRESRYGPDPVRWMIVTGLNGFTSLIGLAFALTIVAHPAHEAVPWWIPFTWTIGFGLAAVVAMRRMRRHRRRVITAATQV